MLLYHSFILTVQFVFDLFMSLLQQTPLTRTTMGVFYYYAELLLQVMTVRKIHEEGSPLHWMGGEKISRIVSNRKSSSFLLFFWNSIITTFS